MRQVFIAYFSMFCCIFTKIAYYRIMDKRELSTVFRHSLREILEGEEHGIAPFLRDTGLDRSALSQFLDPKLDRLPRAETLRRIAEARGISIDWLLGMENAREGRQELASSFQIENALTEDGSSPLERWHLEAEGHKLRYVPSTLPDMLILRPENQQDAHPSTVSAGGENVMAGLEIGDRDIEIAMPIQTIEHLAQGSGIWKDTSNALRRAQLHHMADVCEAQYPALRIHLFDGRNTFSAPFTVFGKFRVALYVGDSYLVVTAVEQVRTFVKRFDHLVRKTIIGADIAHGTFRALAEGVDT